LGDGRWFDFGLEGIIEYILNVVTSLLLSSSVQCATIGSVGHPEGLEGEENEAAQEVFSFRWLADKKSPRRRTGGGL
jgi:hypothetical protein